MAEPDTQPPIMASDLLELLDEFALAWQTMVTAGGPWPDGGVRVPELAEQDIATGLFHIQALQALLGMHHAALTHPTFRPLGGWVPR